jgi:hypothetical protein
LKGIAPNGRRRMTRSVAAWAARCCRSPRPSWRGRVRPRPEHSVGRATQGLRGKLYREQLDTFHKLLLGTILHGRMGRSLISGASPHRVLLAAWNGDDSLR